MARKEPPGRSRDGAAAARRRGGGETSGGRSAIRRPGATPSAGGTERVSARPRGAGRKSGPRTRAAERGPRERGPRPDAPGGPARRDRRPGGPQRGARGLRARRRRVYRLAVAEGQGGRRPRRDLSRPRGARRRGARRVPRADLDGDGRPRPPGGGGLCGPLPVCDLDEILARAEGAASPFLLALDPSGPAERRLAPAPPPRRSACTARWSPSAARPASPRREPGLRRAVEHLPVARSPTWCGARGAQERGVWVVGSRGGEAQDMGRGSLMPWCSSWGRGAGDAPIGARDVRPPEAAADAREVTSLNVSVAGSVVLYRAWESRRRRTVTASRAGFDSALGCAILLIRSPRTPRGVAASGRCADVAQRQSSGFVNRRLWVQVPPSALARRRAFRTTRYLGRYPSGQRGLTVNQLAMPSEVRILPCPLVRSGLDAFGCPRSSDGRARSW